MRIRLIVGAAALASLLLAVGAVAEPPGSGAAATVLGIEYADARHYGRLVRGAGGSLERIVEARDATPEELELREANSSIYAFRSDALWPTLDRIEAKNAQGELYLTDAIGMLYDSLVRFRPVKDSEDSAVRREDLAFHPTMKYGWALEGKLAQSWELTKGGRKAIFHLKKGIKSNWGNELTAKDVKWTWDRHFALKGVGGFFIGVPPVGGLQVVDPRVTVTVNGALSPAAFETTRVTTYVPGNAYS